MLFPSQPLDTCKIRSIILKIIESLSIHKAIVDWGWKMGKEKVLFTVPLNVLLATWRSCGSRTLSGPGAFPSDAELAVSL